MSIYAAWELGFRPANAVESEFKAFCFAIHDLTTRQPWKLKLRFALLKMQENVRPNCGYAMWGVVRIYRMMMKVTIT